MKHFIKPDLFTIIISVFCIVLLVYLVFKTIHYPYWSIFSITLVVFLAFAYFATKMPIYTYADKNKIMVKQLIGRKVFNRDTVYTQKISNVDMKGTFRLFGSGGFLGYIGWFSNPALGKFYMIAGNKKDLLLITTATGRKYVINCPLN
ncbi:MAG: PH domain-containing protein [Prevotellaceae bacterium]|jgi:hypothetical protein|nr:PH domain-containing protein [Prevotellaceae bacterium]